MFDKIKTLDILLDTFQELNFAFAPYLNFVHSLFALNDTSSPTLNLGSPLYAFITLVAYLLEDTLSHSA